MNTPTTPVTRFEGVNLGPTDAAEACDNCGEPLVVLAFRVTTAAATDTAAHDGPAEPTPLAIVCPACADEVCAGGLPALHARRRAVIRDLIGRAAGLRCTGGTIPGDGDVVVRERTAGGL